MAAMAKQAFVCYARKDEQFVLPLAANLQKRGCSLWVDKWDIPPGANWDRTVDGALRSCRVFLFVMSPNAVNSSEVEGELRTALDLHLSIVPVLYRGCEIPRQLRTTQYVDFSHGNPNHEASLQQLVETLKHWNTALLGHPPIPDSAPHWPPRRANVDTQASAQRQSLRGRVLQLEPWQYAVLFAGVGLFLAILVYFAYLHSPKRIKVPLHSHLSTPMGTSSSSIPAIDPAAHPSQLALRSHVRAFLGAHMAASESVSSLPYPPTSKIIEEALLIPIPAVGNASVRAKLNDIRGAPSRAAALRHPKREGTVATQKAIAFMDHFSSMAHGITG